MKIFKEEARDILWGDSDNGELIQDDIIGHSRWSVEHEIVIRYKGDYYIGYYSKGATEHQDEQAWEYEEEVEFFPAKKVEKVIEIWERE